VGGREELKISGMKKKTFMINEALRKEALPGYQALARQVQVID
jgi:hypothetical protein